MAMVLHVRPESPDDREAIRTVIEAAFRENSHSNETEAEIIEGLRDAGALTLSLVAVDLEGDILGHIAFSPVSDRKSVV